MPATLSTQPPSAQKLFDRISLLPLNQKQRLVARRIVSSLKDKERRTLEKVLDSDENRAGKLILNAVATYECLIANDLPGIKRIIKDDAALLKS